MCPNKIRAQELYQSILEVFMNSKLLQSMRHTSLIFLLAILFTACEKNSEGRNPVSDPPAQAGGGIDGSGGNIEQSSPAQVDAAFKKIAANFSRIMRIVERNNYGSGLSGQFSSKDYDLKYGSGAKKMVKDYLYAKPSLEGNVYPVGESVADSVEKGNVEIEGNSQGCTLAAKDHDGWASGNLKKGKVCIDLRRLTRVPAKNLEEQIFLLLIHETSHLSGFAEDKAIGIQTLFSNHPGIYSLENRDPEPFGSSSKCTAEIAAKNIQMLKGSNYWMKKKAELVDVLSGISSAGGPKAYRFADDVEWIWANLVKFDVHEMGAVYLANPILGGGNKRTFFGVDKHQGLMTNVYLHLETDNAVLGRISSQIGTEAQCDPKVLLANLTVAAKVALNQTSGDPNLFIKEEQDLLLAEPHEIPLQSCDMETASKYVKEVLKVNSYAMGTNTIMDEYRELTLFQVKYDKNKKECENHFKCDPLKTGYETVLNTCP